MYMIGILNYMFIDVYMYVSFFLGIVGGGYY